MIEADEHVMGVVMGVVSGTDPMTRQADMPGRHASARRFRAMLTMAPPTGGEAERLDDLRVRRPTMKIRTATATATAPGAVHAGGLRTGLRAMSSSRLTRWTRRPGTGRSVVITYSDPLVTDS
ncbi:hypothetical protein [Streptomyces sp. NPDC087437]|uniref:hypothetical protein n=1 Tax=Streptomyces sp. NPDC087437 TaxID=3365789 RepID=UPI0037F53934